MRAKSERQKVEIKESSTTEARTFSITLTAPANDFLLTDLLRQRGGVDPLHTELKQAVKGATERYLNAAETLVAGLITKPNGARKSRSNVNRKGKPAESLPGVSRTQPGESVA